ncbi:unnamed protein product [Dovyalis caffra]|uniref:Gnk2-homologous domain-containing protein n=1 Tax=Dovyalis caffra TaxID=77055 RepID=A0AAV1SKR4_9ROSI|nr:unnamed protein product [Dovyalis caffra]
MHASLNIAETDFLDQYCGNVGNYTTNSNFQRNLNSLLSSLNSNSQIDYGFYNLSVGQTGPDKANAIAICRGDIGEEECRSCIRNSTGKILQVCPNQKEAFGISETCILRYSNKSTFGVMEDYPVSILVNSKNATDVNQFNQALQTLMSRLRSTAASGNSLRKFATGNGTAGFDTIFGLVQCTPDLSEEQCDDCLAGAIREIAACCGGQIVGKQGARITTPSCNIRYEVYRFFGVTPSIPQGPTLPSPQAQPVAPPPPPAEATSVFAGKKSNKARTIILITVPTVTITWRNWREGTALNVIDPALSKGSRTEMMRSIHIGLLCVQENIADRPTMASIVLMLSSYSLTMPTPSQPPFLTNSNTNQSNMSSSMDYNSRVTNSSEAQAEVLPFSANEASIT